MQHDGPNSRHRPGPLRRLRLALRSYSLDDRILAREPVDGDRELAEREEVLLDPGVRAKLARGLVALTREVRRPAGRSFFSSRLPLRRREIAGASAHLQDLARALAEEPEVSPRGVILARRLLYDGDSPLFAAHDPLFDEAAPRRQPVEIAVRHARTALLMG
jgi:hypothetical protein